MIPLGPWAFHNPVPVHFGFGIIKRLAGLVTCAHPLLVTTPGFTRRGMVAEIQSLLPGRTVTVFDRVEPNPDLTALETAVSQLTPLGPNQIIAVGGGSVLDTAKVLSVFLAPAAAGFSLRNHFQKGAALPPAPFLPVIAIPTTAGTGAEVTPFATVWEMAAHKKHSLASPHLYPQAAVLDPELTLNLPWDLTLATALDALSQALESTWNRHATPITLALATQAARLAMAALPGLAADLSNGALRSDLMAASLMAGLCISQTRTSLAHSISYPLTARFGMPHGLACGFTLPEILNFNLPADDGRLSALAQSLGEGSSADLGHRLEELLARLNVGSAVAKYIPNVKALEPYVGEMLTPGRADNSLRVADIAAVEAILQKTFTRCLTSSSSQAFGRQP